MKTWSDAETTRGHDLRVRQRRPWSLLALVAAVALIIYQLPLIKVAILQHCSRNIDQSDLYKQQWENFNWDAVSGSSVPFGTSTVILPHVEHPMHRQQMYGVRQAAHKSRYMYHTVERCLWVDDAVRLCTWDATTPPPFQGFPCRMRA